MAKDEIKADQVREYLQLLTQQARRRLLEETERLQASGANVPAADVILAELRAEFRNTGQAHYRVGNPSRYFFQPLEPLLTNRSPDCAHAGQISRGSLSVIWESICQHHLPTMARDYTDKMNRLIAARDLDEAERVVAGFQSKALKYLEGTLASFDGAERTRTDLATYTTSRATFDDLAKMLSVLRAREALTAFSNALPPTIDNLDKQRLGQVLSVLNAFAAKHAEAMPFALTIVANRLKMPWQLIRLATKMAKSKAAADIAATPYAMAVPMILSRLDDRRLVLRDALKSGRVLIARDILADIYATEDALRLHIDQLGDSAWGRGLDEVITAVAALVEAEVGTIPKDQQHVLQSRSLRSHDSLTQRLRSLAWKGRDALGRGLAKLGNG
jgi:hypothetical protein